MSKIDISRKAAQKKAAIGFSYDGSETVPGQSKFQKKGDSSESESEEEIDEPEEVIGESCEILPFFSYTRFQKCASTWTVSLRRRVRS